jgi:hypothetical protein
MKYSELYGELRILLIALAFLLAALMTGARPVFS